MLEEKVVNKLIENKETIASMESCTGGFLAVTLTNVENSSKVLKFSAVTYSNEYKIKMGVSKEIIDKYSVYSFEVSRQMSKCISDYACSTYGIGITGKINKVDENNMFGLDNEVFVTIYNRKDKTYNDYKIICPNETREECKKYIVNEILNYLLKII